MVPSSHGNAYVHFNGNGLVHGHCNAHAHGNGHARIYEFKVPVSLLILF